MRYLQGHAGYNIKTDLFDKDTGLFFAAARNRVETVRVLLDHGTSEEERGTVTPPKHIEALYLTHISGNALDIAVKLDFAPIVQLLLERGVSKPALGERFKIHTVSKA